MVLLRCFPGRPWLYQEEPKEASSSFLEQLSSSQRKQQRNASLPNSKALEFSGASENQALAQAFSKKPACQQSRPLQAQNSDKNHASPIPNPGFSHGWNKYIFQLQSGKPMATDQLHLASPHRHRAGSWCSRWLVGGVQSVKKTNPRMPLWKGSYLPTNLTSNLHHQLTTSWLPKQNSWGVGPGFSWPQPLSNMEHKDSRPHIWSYGCSRVLCWHVCDPPIPDHKGLPGARDSLWDSSCNFA